MSVPLTVHYLGHERYGLWMTISAVVAMLGFVDLGLGNGLLNGISEANGREDRDLARRYVSSTLLMLCAVGLIIAICFAAAYPVIDWPKLFSVTSTVACAEVGPAVAVFIGCFVVGLPLSIVGRVQLGYQEGFSNALWTAAGNLLALAGVFLAIQLRAGLPWLVLAMSGAPSFVVLLNAVALFVGRFCWLLPRLRFASGGAALHLFRAGLPFLVLQVAIVLAFASDNLIIAKIIGPEAVTSSFCAIAVVRDHCYDYERAPHATLAGHGEAIARGDTPWVRRTLRRSLKLSLWLSGLIALVLIIGGRQIIHWWVGPEIDPSYGAIIGTGNLVSSCGAGQCRRRFPEWDELDAHPDLFGCHDGRCSVAAKVVLASTVGLDGVIWGTIGAYLLCSVLPLAFWLLLGECLR